MQSNKFSQFLGGTNYTKSFKEETNEPNCIKIGTTERTMYDEVGRTKSSEITFSYKCTEADFWWGILSASFIFVPGKLPTLKNLENNYIFFFRTPLL